MDWHEWHDAYDSPDSYLSRRLALIQERIRAALDTAPPGPSPRSASARDRAAT